MKQQRKNVPRYAEGHRPELPGTGLGGTSSHLVSWLGAHGIAGDMLPGGYRRCVNGRIGICAHTAG